MVFVGENLCFSWFGSGPWFLGDQNQVFWHPSRSPPGRLGAAWPTGRINPNTQWRRVVFPWRWLTVGLFPVVRGRELNRGSCGFVAVVTRLPVPEKKTRPLKEVSAS